MSYKTWTPTRISIQTPAQDIIFYISEFRYCSQTLSCQKMCTSEFLQSIILLASCTTRSYIRTAWTLPWKHMLQLAPASMKHEAYSSFKMLSPSSLVLDSLFFQTRQEITVKKIVDRFGHYCGVCFSSKLFPFCRLCFKFPAYQLKALAVVAYNRKIYFCFRIGIAVTNQRTSYNLGGQRKIHLYFLPACQQTAFNLKYFFRNLLTSQALDSTVSALLLQKCWKFQYLFQKFGSEIQC